MSLIEQRYTPHGKKVSGGKDAAGQWMQMIQLGLTLGFRNIKSKYRQSILGMFWAFVPPVSTAIVWIFLSGSGVIRMQETGVPYPVYVIFGTTLWQLFVQGVNVPMAAVNGNKSILIKINFSRASVLVAGLIEMLIPLMAAAIIMLVVMIWYGIVPGPELAAGLLMMILFILLGFSLGLYLLPVGLLYKDVQYGLGTFLQFMMYLSPVIYPQIRFPGFGQVLDYNPLSPIVVSAREWILNMPPTYGYEYLLYYLLGITAILLLGLRIFRISMEVLIERMGT